MDIGSGSVRLLLNGKKTTIMTKLGEGLGESDRLCEAGMRRTVATIRELTEKARAAGADVVAFATEAVRAGGEPQRVPQTRAGRMRADRRGHKRL